MITTWSEAEEFAASHMRALGFEDAETTTGGADGGIDVRATRAVAQVKHFAESAVGSPAVQQLAGATDRHQVGLFYALSGFTKAAVQEAESRGIALFVYSVAEEVTPVTTHAERMVENGFFVWSAPPLTGSLGRIFRVMDAEGQLVVNTGSVIVNQVINRLQETVEQLPDDEKQAFVAQLNRALTSSKATVEAWSETRDIRDYLEDLAKLVSIQRWLAESVGLDYEEIDAQVKAEADQR